MIATFDSTELLKQGHVWVAPVWNHTKHKFTPRPIVIVGNETANDNLNLIICFITKQCPRDQFDIAIEHWQEAGLDCLSWVRTSKPITMTKDKLRLEYIERDGKMSPRGYVGELNNLDLAQVITMCRSIF